MPAKSDFPFPPVDVSVVLIENDRGELLFDFNHPWGAFTLPMSKRRGLPPATEYGTPTIETAREAAARAAAEVLGRPLDPATLTGANLDVPHYHQSGRDGAWKRYAYSVFTLTHTGTPVPVPGHTAVWLARADLAKLAPLSPTVDLVLSAPAKS